MRESASWVLGARAAVVITTEALHLAHDWCKVWGMTTTKTTTDRVHELYRWDLDDHGCPMSAPCQVPATVIDHPEDAETEAYAAATWAHLYGLNPLDYEGDTSWESSYGGGYDARDTTVPGELFGAPYEVARDAYEGYRR